MGAPPTKHPAAAGRAAGLARIGLALACLAAVGASASSVTWTTASDWSAWTWAPGTLAIGKEGQVSPRYYRKDVNACLDAHEYTWVDKLQQQRTGGIRNAGSNAAAAGNVIDGDLATAWGPNRADPPENWWVEIDLGRLVTASGIVVRFAADADPFEEFRIFASDGTPAFVSVAVADAPDYQAVASITKPNRETVLEFPLRDAYNADVPHRSVRYVFVQINAWRDPQSRPRLAELEVIALGDNVVMGTQKRGGDVAAYSVGGVAANLIDGDGVSFWDSSRWQTFPEAHWYFHLNLGARFWVDTIVLIAYPPSILGGSVTPLVHHSIEVSEGTPQPGMAQAWVAKGPYVWTEVDRVSENPPAGSDRPLYVLESRFAPRQVARIFYDHLTPQNISAGNIRLREIQAYGQGYIPQATLQSGFIDLGTSSAVSSLDWEGQTPPGTAIQVRTRTGDTVIEQTTYYTKDGQEVRDKNNSGTAKDEYDGLPPFRRGQIASVTIAGTGWSGWSAPYLERSGLFHSPSPRRYLQLEAALATEEPEAAAALDLIRVWYAPPLARSVVGEIYPTQVAAAGVPQDFAYFIRPTFDARSRGFDVLSIRTPSTPQLLGLRVDGVPVTPDSLRASADSLWLRLPLVRRQGDVLVEVDFRCTVTVSGTPFEAFLGLSSDPATLQRVDAGDADPATDSQRTVVSAPLGDHLLEWTTPQTGPITPNGDGVNDECAVEFVVHRLSEPRPLAVTVFDLSGRRVRELSLSGASDRYRVAWDGRDGNGHLVRPGTYVVEVFVDSALRDAVLTRMVAVAY